MNPEQAIRREFFSQTTMLDYSFEYDFEAGTPTVLRLQDAWKPDKYFDLQLRMTPDDVVLGSVCLAYIVSMESPTVVRADHPDWKDVQP